MARYIDAYELSIYFDALIKHAEMEGLYNMAHVYERCLQIVKDAPSADVAPRAEVAVEVIDDIWNFVESRNGVGYVSIGIVEIKRRLYELKKKYTEAEPPKGEKHDPA